MKKTTSTKSEKIIEKHGSYLCTLAYYWHSGLNLSAQEQKDISHLAPHELHGMAEAHRKLVVKY
jgi:hypothetical protein